MVTKLNRPKDALLEDFHKIHEIAIEYHRINVVPNNKNKNTFDSRTTF